MNIIIFNIIIFTGTINLLPLYYSIINIIYLNMLNIILQSGNQNIELILFDNNCIKSKLYFEFRYIEYFSIYLYNIKMTINK